MGVCVSKDRQLFPTTSNQIAASMVSQAVILASTSHADIQNHYEFRRLIGHGQYGTVREATRKGSGLQVAIKSINKAKIQKDLYLLRREMDIMRVIDHPNLISYYEAYEDEKYFHIVMELCNGGDLMDRLALTGAMNEADAVTLTQQMLTALNHLHGLNICHRDLKPENFLFFSKDLTSQLKLIDFGMSISVRPSRELTTFVGTPYYLAPEVLQGNYSLECDVWSLGVILFLMLCAAQPFDGDDMAEIFYRIAQGKPQLKGEWNKLSKEAKDLLQKMLTVRVPKRITIPEILNHPWFSPKNTSSNTVPTSVLLSLKAYKAPSKLQHEVMKVMIRYMSAEDIEDLKTVFMEMDVGHTGFLAVSDLEKAMQKAGFSTPASELSSNFQAEIDQFHQGKIKYTDFLMATLDKKRLLAEEMLYLTFQRFDIDNDGSINVHDLKSAINNLSDEDLSIQEIEAMIADWDLDNNRQIDYAEFKRMMEDQTNPAEEQSRSPVRRATVKKTLTRLAAPLS